MSSRALLCCMMLSACGWACGGSSAEAVEPAPQPLVCSQRLSRQLLDRSIALGTAFMLNHQTHEGHFGYAYDWHAGQHIDDDSEVRQAGASWGLALLHRDAPSPKLRAALTDALAFFARHAQVVDGRRFVSYPGAKRGSLGTVALLALAHIDYLRSDPDDAAVYRLHLDQLLAFIVHAHREEGRFAAAYDLQDGRPYGRPSPYYDGEALLALVKAAMYLGRSDLMPLARFEARAGHQHNVVQALAADPDSDTTKGYYQWSSMAYYELATQPAATAHGSATTEPWGNWLLELADWMVDVHRTLARTRNTAYAYEGIVPAYALARARGDSVRTRRFGCVIEAGLWRLSSWQIGNPIANPFIRAKATHDRLAIGGVQNHAREPELRIDVVQHQMHALLLARELYLPAAR
jgi:hypothetical protein